jgi:ABC-type multidrug transport system fused ATPase/permease subunit
VSFSYPNADVDVLKDITVHIKNGERIAVVGENGSGKSTFISLLCGMFDPNLGRISIDGTNLAENPALAREAVSVVFQDFAHYEATLRENITISDKHCNASDDEIMELLHKINVDDVVAEQPNGLDELVGSFSEKANNLSGGQWQKISIARAAYRQDAKIMILDEPTSALDPVAEAQLYRNFADLTGDKTTILISHRLGITSVVDRILVFKDGRIIEDGSHKQLMAKNGHYAEMYRAQAQWYV